VRDHYEQKRVKRGPDIPSLAFLQDAEMNRSPSPVKHGPSTPSPTFLLEAEMNRTPTPPVHTAETRPDYYNSPPSSPWHTLPELFRNKRVYVAESLIPGAGYGLFAARRIFRGDNIASYGGVFTRKDPKNGLAVQLYSKLHVKEAENYGTKSGFIDGAHATNARVPQDKDGRVVASYANSYRSGMGEIFGKRGNNAELVQTQARSIMLKAIREIQKGDEILCRYGRGYFEKGEEPIQVVGPEHRKKKPKKKRKSRLTLQPSDK
jgi:hypothetical protein